MFTITMCESVGVCGFAYQVFGYLEATRGKEEMEGDCVAGKDGGLVVAAEREVVELLISS
jgi:hypothetical protein